MTVYLAYYHNGFYDDYPQLLGVCSSNDCADKLIEYHKQSRDKEEELDDNTRWWTEEKLVLISRADF